MLCNVAFYPGVAVSTDSYRLAIISYGDQEPERDAEPLLVNTDAAKSLRALLAKKLGALTFATLDGFHVADFEDVRWSLRRSMPYKRDDGTSSYPNWRNLLPDEDPRTTLKVDREDLLAGSRSAGSIGRRDAPLRLRVDGVDASVTSNTPDRASMSRRLASGDATGDIEIGFNPHFLADICAVAPVERLTVQMFSPLRPALVEAARDRYLLMPIRLKV